MHALPVASIIAFALLTACTPSPTSAPRRYDFQTYSISVPSNWTRIDYGPGQSHKGVYGFIGAGVRFEGPAGEYLDICPDIAIDIHGADTWYSGKALADGAFDIQGQDILCTPAKVSPGTREDELPYAPSCTRGDGRLDGFMFFEGRGHGYVITFGNDNRERVEDFAPLRQVLQTLKVK